MHIEPRDATSASRSSGLQPLSLRMEGVGESARPVNEDEPAQLVSRSSYARFAASTLAMVVLAFPTLANAQTSIDVADTAQLIAKGAGAVVSVEITCAVPTNNVSIDVTLVQRAGSKTTSGSGNVGGFPSDINCSPEPTTVEVPVAVFGRVFKQGVAIALANISECNPDFSNCFSGNATQEIRLVK